jgi:hypothetical protein
MDDNEKLILAIARAIEGPYGFNEHMTEERLDQLRGIRWQALSTQERNARLCQARAALTVARGFA